MGRFKCPRSLRSLAIHVLIGRTLKNAANSSDASSTQIVLPPSVSTDLIAAAYQLQLYGQVTTLQYNDLIRTFGPTLTKLTLELTDAYCGESSVTLLEVTRNILRTVAEPTDPTFFRDLTIYGHWLPWKTCDLSRTLSFTRGLTSLTLYVRGLNDVIMKAVAISCRNLNHLALEGTQFSDCAIKSLAGYIWTSGTQDLEAFGTPGLRTFVLTESGDDLRPLFTEHSIRTILSQLTCLNCVSLPTDHVTQAIESLVKINPNTQLSLTKYTGSVKVLEAIVNCCPCLTSLELLVKYNYDFSKLIFLKRLPHLHEISFFPVANEHNFYDFECNYRTNLSLYQLLSEIGTKIYQIEIHLEMAIDLDTISKLCPNLVTLELTNVVGLSQRSTNSRTANANEAHLSQLRNLKNLKILAHSDNRICENELIDMLINCCNLEFLFIGWIESFGDHVISEVLKWNQLPELSRVELHEASSALTTAGVTHLMFSINKLSHVHLLGSEGITSEEADALRCLVHEANLDLELKYQSW